LRLVRDYVRRKREGRLMSPKMAEETPITVVEMIVKRDLKGGLEGALPRDAFA
jgi:hypothetical protein